MKAGRIKQFYHSGLKSSRKIFLLRPLILPNFRISDSITGSNKKLILKDCFDIIAPENKI
jgi:hypothetical protein